MGWSFAATIVCSGAVPLQRRRHPMKTQWKKIAGGLAVAALFTLITGCDKSGSGASGAASSAMAPAAPASPASGP
jgi:putative effector of murein hydrolase